jgi:hemerythrin-like domain-containing protein
LVVDPRMHLPMVDRRDLMGLSTAVAAGLGLTACGSSTGADPKARAPSAVAEVPVTPPEDLMREHGVLKRVLLIYREAIRRIQAGAPAPDQELHASARIIRSFIEDYHEHLEEQYIFPRLRKAGKLNDITTVLLTQHRRGRTVTDQILATANPPRSSEAQARRRLADALTAFVRMYEPHEAREDTVVFPVFREIVPPKEFAQLGETFEDEEHRRFGQAGFTGIVNQVADIEKSFGIYDLAQFTPHA